MPQAEHPITEEFSPEAIEQGRRLFAKGAAFERGAGSLESLPPGDLPEIAFSGRSNVGKSSLINALTGRRALARVSDTPGRTRELNFFRLPETDPLLFLVDLPGYGYARAPKTMTHAWQDLLFAYLRGRRQLLRVFLLIDGRHGLKETDGPVMKDLDEAAVSYRIVLTKADKVKPTERAGLIERTEAALKRHPAAHPNILLTSAHDGAGLAELRAEIARLAGN